MRFRTIWLSLLVALAATLAVVPFVGAQDPEQDDVRGAFLTSRPKTVEKPSNNTSSRPVRRRPKPQVTKPPQKDPGETGSKDGGVSTGDKQGRSANQRLGLGLTLFIRDSNGLAIRVDPNHEFQKGDRVRVLLETNADGHLYIFNTTDDGDPVMVYPNPQLDDAGNFIQAHVPFEIPSSLATEDRLRWLTFDEHGGTERLYFVFTREPLAGVPIEDELIKYCADNKLQCGWHPAGELWTGLKKEMETPSRADNAKKFGKAQTSAEQEAATRGIGLAREDAQPSMVIMTASSGPGMLVTALELLHK
ncbi:MAG: hypothetical protein JWM21_65 [Acidobacteria bacterium]|nr:hypothetical protein [Acidobacteriota bacterium]